MTAEEIAAKLDALDCDVDFLSKTQVQMTDRRNPLRVITVHVNQLAGALLVYTDLRAKHARRAHTLVA